MNDLNNPFKPIDSSRATRAESRFVWRLEQQDCNITEGHNNFSKKFIYKKVFVSPGPDETKGLQPPMNPPPGQTATIDDKSPLEKRSITIADEEFDDPPAKMKKMALAIKTFFKSFKEMIVVNNPETDRSARVETIRSKVFAVVSTVTRILEKVLPVVLYIGALCGIGVAFFFLIEFSLYFVFTAPVITIVSMLVAVPIFDLCNMFIPRIERFIPAAVAAAEDTRDKLTEMTACPRQVRFLKKYRRMEECHLALQIKRYAVKLDEINGNPHSCPELKAKLRASLESEMAEAGIANPGNDKWYVAYQRRCLRNRYRGDIKHLDEAISKTKDWLDRAAEQKNLLIKAQQELNDQYAPEKPVDWKMDEKLENPVHCIPV